MRLIDADLLLEELNRFSMRITGSANAMALMVMDETKKSIAKMVDNQPTAYNVDKVVEQINNLDIKAIPRYKGGTFGDYEGMDYYIKKSDVLEILKTGLMQ